MKSRWLTVVVVSTCSIVFAQDGSFELYRAHVAAAEAYLDLDLVAEAQEHLVSAPAKHRGWEWRYLNARADVSRKTIHAHSQSVWAVASQPKGRLFATASADSTIRIWSFPDGTPVVTLRGHTGQVMAIDFSPDGTQLVSGATDKSVRIWDISTGANTQTFKEGLTQRVYSVRFAPDGTRIVATSWEFNRQKRSVEGFALLYDVTNGTLIRRYDVTGHPEASADFLPDGRSFVTGGWGLTVRRHATDSLHRFWDFNMEDVEGYAAVQYVDVGVDGKQVVVGSKDDRIRVFDAISGSLKFETPMGTGHRDDVNAVAYSPDGSQIASASSDGLVIIWNGETGRKARTLRGHTSALNGVAWSADGRYLVSGSSDGKVKIWNADDDLERSFNVCEAGPWNAPISPDGTFMVTACGGKGIGVWNISTATQIGTLPERSANAAAISADGKYALTGAHDMMVRYWDLSTRSELYALSGHSSGIFGVDLHPTRPIAASASSDRTVRLWDLDKRSELALLDSGSTGMYTVRFSRDGRLVVAGGDGGMVKIWRVSDRKLLATWAFGDAVKELAFNKKSDMLAATGGRGSVGLWNVKTMEPSHTLAGHSNSVYAVTFLPDGKRLVTASYDRSVRLWDVSSGKSMLTVRGGQHEYYTASFLKDGQELLLTDVNGGVKIVGVVDGRPE